MAAIFCAVAPHLGWRHIEERAGKTRRDYALFLRALCDKHFPTAQRIVLVQDNLNTHRPASLYEAVPAGAGGTDQSTLFSSTSPPSTEVGLTSPKSN